MNIENWGGTHPYSTKNAHATKQVRELCCSAEHQVEMIVDNPEKFTKSTLTFKTSYGLSQEEILRRHLVEQEKIQAKLQAIAAKEQERLQAEAAKERERLQKEAELELKRQQEEAALEK